MALVLNKPVFGYLTGATPLVARVAVHWHEGRAVDGDGLMVEISACR